MTKDELVQEIARRGRGMGVEDRAPHELLARYVTEAVAERKNLGAKKGELVALLEELDQAQQSA